MFEFFTNLFGSEFAIFYILMAVVVIIPIISGLFRARANDMMKPYIIVTVLFTLIYVAVFIAPYILKVDIIERVLLHYTTIILLSFVHETVLSVIWMIAAKRNGETGKLISEIVTIVLDAAFTVFLLRW